MLKSWEMSVYEVSLTCEKRWSIYIEKFYLFAEVIPSKNAKHTYTHIYIYVHVCTRIFKNFFKMVVQSLNNVYYNF